MGSLKEGLKKVIGIEDFEDEYLPEKPEKKGFDNEYTNIQPERMVMPEPFRPKSLSDLGNYNLLVVEPKSYDKDCPKLVDNLKEGKSVIVNFENVQTETAKKAFDFLNGATYALNGKTHKITNNIFIFAPETVVVNEQLINKEQLTK